MRVVLAGERPAETEELRRALADHGFDQVSVEADLSNLERLTQADVLMVSTDADQWRNVLLQLRATKPAMVRLLLADSESANLQLFDGAHRVLTAPVEAADLAHAIDSINHLRERLDAPRLRDYVGQVAHLPVAPQTFLRLTRLMAQDHVSFVRIASEIEREPGLVAELLRLCNSAYFGTGREVSDVRMAITRLGLVTVQRLVLASEAYGQGAEHLTGTEVLALQERALRISRLAGLLLTESSFDMVTTAGLLTQVGHLLPPPSSFDGMPPSYQEAGAFLLGLWGLPMPIVEAVAFHRQPELSSDPGFWLAGAVHVASSLITGEPVDEDYLAAVGVLDRLPHWRKLAAQVAAMSLDQA